MLTFAEYLRQRRLGRGLTMQALASELSVTPQFISLLESNRRRPSSTFLERCAAYFGDDLEFLRFLVQPISPAQRRAIYESPVAPAYIPRSLRHQSSYYDECDRLMENLLVPPEAPFPERDTPFHLKEWPLITEESIALQRRVAAYLRAHPDRFSGRVRAWAEFFEVYFLRALQGREAACAAFEQLAERFRSAPPVPPSHKLHFLLALHSALCFAVVGRTDEAAIEFHVAFDQARSALDVENAVAALWLSADAYRRSGDVIHAAQQLRTALGIEQISPFALARCRTDLVDLLLLLGEDVAALENAETVIPLWRSSTLQAPQSFKTASLFRTHLGAAEACINLDRPTEARAWLGRARSIRTRMEPSRHQEARLLWLSGRLLLHSGRVNQASSRLREAWESAPSATEEERLLRLRALAALCDAECRRGKLETVRTLVERFAEEEPFRAPIYELRRAADLTFCRCALAHRQREPDALTSALDAFLSTLEETVACDPALRDYPLVERIHSDIDRWRGSVAGL